MMLEITRFDSVTDTAGKRRAVTWNQLATLLSQWRQVSTKLDAGLWSPAAFSGTRSEANVVAVAALVLDFDGGVPLSAVLAAGTGFSLVWHTSWSHSSLHPRFRVAFELSRALTPDEHARVWNWSYRTFCSGSGTPDPACKDASRAWLLPSGPRSSFAFGQVTGAPLDVNAILTTTPAPAKPRRHGTGAAPPVTGVMPIRVESLLRSVHKIALLYKGTKMGGDESRSGCDFSFALELLRRGVSSDDVHQALRLRPGVHSRDDRYLLRTVASARASLKVN